MNRHTPAPKAAAPAIWVQTHSGRAVDLINPQPWMIDFNDIAVHLSRINRFNGATADCAYSVAQHCAVGAKFLADRKDETGARAFLLHDAHEAYIGDIITPVQKALDWHLHGLFCQKLHKLKREIDEVIFAAAGMDRPSDYNRVAEVVFTVDSMLLRSEQLQLMAKPPHPWGCEDVPPLPMRGGLKMMTALDAEMLWLEWFDRLFPGVRARR